MSLVNFNEKFKDRSIKFTVLVLIIMSLLALMTLFVITLLKIKNNEHVRILGFELNIPNAHDTLYKAETILYKSDTIIKYRKTIQPVQPIGPSKVIDAKNINVGNNNGIVGDYGTINRAEQRHLDDSLKKRLTAKVDTFLKDHNLNKQTSILLSFPLGDKEAAIFTSEIKNFLLSMFYNVKGISMDSNGFAYGFTIRQIDDDFYNIQGIEIAIGAIGIGSGKL